MTPPGNTPSPLRYLPVQQIAPERLAAFFVLLAGNGDDLFFHPHPLTAAEAQYRCQDQGQDLYVVQLLGEELTGYGMLRGWDEGYAIPSLGIAIHPQRRGQGLGELLMHHLHDLARNRGAAQVRLSVEAGNHQARAFYRRLGYRFQEAEDGTRAIGWLNLDSDGR
jgi:[ribosomal protein S18]-alanine N-acetyltransferase